MKNILYVAFLLATNFLWAQSENDKTIYLDSVEKETTSTNYQFTRVIKDYLLVKDTYVVFEYYKSGKIKNEFQVKDRKNINSYTGPHTRYYENGNKKEAYIPIVKDDSISKHIYYYENGIVRSELLINESKKTGKSTDYYPNGNKKETREFNYNRFPKKTHGKILQFWDSNNKQLVINGNGDYLLDDAEGNVSGKVKDGEKVGEWITYSKLHKSKNIETFDITGIFKKGITITDDGKKFEYTEFESQPKPKKGMQDFVNYLVNQLKKEYLGKTISGKLIIEFVIEKDGSLVEPKIIRSISPELDEKAANILTSYENWIPGHQNGQQVRARYVLPLNFNLK